MLHVAFVVWLSCCGGVRLLFPSWLLCLPDVMLEEKGVLAAGATICMVAYGLLGWTDQCIALLGSPAQFSEQKCL